MTRYYNTVTRVEEFAPGPDIVVLPPENPFWSQLPDGEELTYDGFGVPNGTQPIPPFSVGSIEAIQEALGAAEIHTGKLALALYSHHHGNSTLLNAINAEITAIALAQSVTEQEVRDVI